MQPPTSLQKILLLSLATVVLDNIRSLHLPIPDAIIELWPLSLVSLVPFFHGQKQLQFFPLLVLPITAMLRCSIQGFPIVLGFGAGIIIGALWTLVTAIDKAVHTNTPSTTLPLRYCILWTALWFTICAQIGTFELLSESLYVVPWLVQPASIIGVFGIEMLLVYFNLYVVSLLDSTRERRKNGVIKIFIAVVFWLSLSLLILYNNNNTDQESIIVATVTPGNLLPSACGGRKEIVHVGGRLPCNGSVHRMLNLTESAAINSGAKLIVWPEAWLSGFNDQQSLQLFLDKEIAPVVKRLGVILTFGATVKPCENLAVTIDNGGSIVSVYGKQCPFWIAGEKSSAKYGFPVFELPSVLSSSRPELSVTNTLGKASTLICYDMDFPATVRTVAGLGASIIVNPSNDWSSMRNHYGVSVFRAIENNIPIVKADGAWDSAIIDGSGKILTEFQSIEAIEKVLVAKVNLKGMSTIATLLGDLIPLLCCSYVVVIIMIICGRTLSGLLQSWKERRRSRSLYAPILDGETP